jgi:hypothetical protein
MGSTAPEQKGTMRQGPGAKRLEGVKATDDLRRLIRDVRSMGTNHAAATSTWESLDESIPSLSSTEAALNLRNFDTSNPFIPFAVLRAVDLLTANDPQHKQRLEACLRSTQLAFTPPPPRGSETEERKKFRRRIEMLKLKQEENRYGGLVKNVGLHAPNDDVTTRSMTYAASIGLNMIVAPLSFGCLMYFFAGGLFNYMGWDENRPAYMGPDIRKVCWLCVVNSNVWLPWSTFLTDFDSTPSPYCPVTLPKGDSRSRFRSTHAND